MSNSKIVEPQQQRSIEKKNRIVAAGFGLFMKKGYYNTNTAQIAKAAGLSTGILYRYFPDKKAVFLEGIKNYFAQITATMFENIKKSYENQSIAEAIDHLITFLEDFHNTSSFAHEEFEGLSRLDPDIAACFYEYEINTTNLIVDLLSQLGIKVEDPRERVYLAYHIVEMYCHETAFRKHTGIESEVLRKIVLETVIHLFEQDGKTT